MINLTGLSLQVPGFALRAIDLRVEERDYFILAGPYASGKTLLLETIAGLRALDAGEIRIAGRDVTRVAAEKRGVGVVFQEAALFPHLTVAENIAFGLRIRGTPAREVTAVVARTADVLGIGNLLARVPGRLSGGEKQKVALARALATNPPVLLLDEPLSALDPQTREKMRREIKRLHRELGLTVVHVTHDFAEAMAMGTRMAVLADGTIQQVGPPDEIFLRPRSRFVAEFTMAVNILRGHVSRNAAGSPAFQAGGLLLPVETDLNGEVLAAVRPENVMISARPPVDATNRWSEARVIDVVRRGAVFDVVVDVPPTLTCLLTRQACEQLGLAEGQRVFLTVASNAVTVFHA